MCNYLYYDYQYHQVCKIYKNKKGYENYPTIQSYLNAQCILYGSSLIGRKEAFQHHTNSKKFTPIYICDTQFYFPNEPLSNSHCLWINYFQIERIENKKNLCIITFQDHTQISLSHPNRIQNILYNIEYYLLIV